MDNLAAYQQLKPFKNFEQITEGQYFIDLPESWYVVLADVKGSTKAIEEGRYRKVNMIGASSIVCVLNAVGSYQFPFVFGGDGSTMVIPAIYADSAMTQLAGLRSLAKRDFNLELRVGMIQLKNLYKQGHTLKVGKLEMSPGNYLAQFKGTALTAAEAMIKGGTSEVQMLGEEHELEAPELSGLSCRLDPLHAKNGVMLTLLCQPRGDSLMENEKILEQLLEKFKHILGEGFASARPVSVDRLHWRLIPKAFFDEIKLHRKNILPMVMFLPKLLATIGINIVIGLGITLGSFKPKLYKQDIVLNSDFKKFDGMLRMVIDCNSEQLAEIKQTLAKLFAAGQIFYGLHESREALMTCMVPSIAQNEHVHFIDGGSGGYAMAAVQLKKQIASFNEHH